MKAHHNRFLESDSIRLSAVEVSVVGRASRFSVSRSHTSVAILPCSSYLTNHTIIHKNEKYIQHETTIHEHETTIHETTIN